MTTISSNFKGTTRFQLQRQLGSGGFGSVYQVFDQDRKTVVALKTLHQADAESLYRFKQEFRSLADMHHPNLVSLYELMSDGEQWFFTMELVNGVNFLEYVWKSSQQQLANIINARTVRVEQDDFATQKNNEATLKNIDAETTENRGNDVSSQNYNVMAQRFLGDSSESHFSEFNLDEGRLRATLQQLAEGLYALHSAGKLHRDLKPSNILVTSQGRVVILDLGLAVEMTSKDIHESMNIVGTPAYMSPEQGARLSVSKASDWYSVGVILYEALTGTLPFTGSMLEVLLRRQELDPKAPIELVKNVPADLNQLCQDLLKRDPKLRPTGEDVLQILSKDKQAKPVTVTTVRNVPVSGRHKELAELREAFQTVVGGNAVTVYLQGRAGIGKSALVNYFLEDLQKQQNAVVLTGRCYGQENVPYKALDSVIDALSQYLKRLPFVEAEALLPRDISILVRLFPVLKQVPAIASARQRAVDTPNAQELRRRASAALRELLARLADKRDLVIFIDDLQWGDADSGVLLSEILRPPEPPALLLIISYRSEDSESPLLAQVFESQSVVASTIDVRKLSVTELSLKDSKRLALLILESKGKEAEALAEIIATESRGNPLLIDELARYSRIDDQLIKSVAQAEESRSDTGVSLINKVIQRRLSQLPSDAQLLLELVAVADQPIKRSVVKKAIELDEQEQAAFSLLRVGRLIRVVNSEGEEKLVPYHDSIKKTVLSYLPEEKLVEHHKRLAQALLELDETDAKNLAIHFRGAGDNEKALQYTIVAAEQAIKALAFDNAARLYRIAIELKPGEKEQDLCVKLGDALANAGRGEESACAYLAAAKDLDPRKAIDLHRRAAEQFLINGYIREGIGVLRKVLATVNIKLPDTTQGALISYLWTRFHLWLRGLGYKETSIGEVSSEALLGIDVCWSAIVGLAYVNTKRALDFQSRHLLMALNAGEPYRVARALALEIAHSATTGTRSHRRNIELCHQAMVMAKQINHPHTNALATLEIGFAAYLEGNWPKAYEMLGRAEIILREQCTGVTWELDTVHYFFIRTLLFLGQLKELQQQLSALMKDAQERGDRMFYTNFRIWSHMVFLGADEPEQAIKEISEAMQDWVRKSFDLQHYWSLYTLVEIDLYSGNYVGAWQRMEKTWPALNSSFFLRTQIIAIESWHLRSRTAIALALDPEQFSKLKLTKAKLISIAEKHVAKMQREKAAWGNAFASLIKAGLASLQDNKKETIRQLIEAEVDFENIKMELYLAATRYRRGQIMGNEQGKALTQSAEEWMQSQKIKVPEKVVNMLVPTKWEGS